MQGEGDVKLGNILLLQGNLLHMKLQSDSQGLTTVLQPFYQRHSPQTTVGVFF